MKTKYTANLKIKYFARAVEFGILFCVFVLAVTFLFVRHSNDTGENSTRLIVAFINADSGERIDLKIMPKMKITSNAPNSSLQVQSDKLCDQPTLKNGLVMYDDCELQNADNANITGFFAKSASIPGFIQYDTSSPHLFNAVVGGDTNVIFKMTLSKSYTVKRNRDRANTTHRESDATAQGWTGDSTPSAGPIDEFLQDE